jgi:hypothetical protein
MSLVTRASEFLEGKVSRRSFVVRSAVAGSAVATGGVGFLLRPGTAYASICGAACGDPSCSCGSTCCAGYTEFCCVINGGYNFCPDNTVMGGWWKADGSDYCEGPRYYMDCNATCSCTSGCGDGYQFCDPACDGLDCGCALGSCDNYLSGCFQFRYGQCNQDVGCLGRIKCRVVACVPPWEIDPTCTTTSATDDGTANQNAACLTPGPTPPPVAVVPCSNVATQCSVVAMAPSHDAKGYAMVTSFGKLFGFGDEVSIGDVSTDHLNRPIVGMAVCSLGGYWFVASDGGVFAFGDAAFLGSTGSIELNKPIVGMAGTPDGKGYWLVASDGGVFAFGDAKFFGSTGSIALNKPIVGMTATSTGKGYWLVASDGGIFAFGDAKFFGSTGSIALNKPIVGMAATPDGKGYWLVASDGGIFTYGDGMFEGSTGSIALDRPIVAMAATATSGGYWLGASDGGIFAFGDAHFYGSPA